MINVQNTDDNECFKWCLVRYLNPADYNPNKDYTRRLDFKDNHKIEKKNSIGISVFGYENKEKYAMYKKKY